jgi:hypothetical protein
MHPEDEQWLSVTFSPLSSLLYGHVCRLGFLAQTTLMMQLGGFQEAMGKFPLPMHVSCNAAHRNSFVDTVHGPGGEGSIWTDNRFTNKFAAMPSLHFGYSLLIGLTIATIPLHPNRSPTRSFIIPCFNRSHPSLAPRIMLPSSQRMVCLVVGFCYPAMILVAIIATANHFILDAVAGSVVCGLAWRGNDVLLNLLVVEDWFLWVVRIHKPATIAVDVEGDEDDFMIKGY